MDHEFSNSYWTYDAKKESRKAFDQFEKQFPGIQFVITRIGTWNSPGSAALAAFPYNIERTLSRSSSEKKLIQGVMIACKRELKIPVKFHESEVIDEVKQATRKRTETYRRSYIAGSLVRRAETYIHNCFLESLQGLPSRNIDLTIGFTGKMCRRTPSGRVESIGWSQIRGSYMVVSLCNTPSYVILHELGHLFGAAHSDQPTSIMYREERNKKTTQFCRESKKVISQKLKAIRAGRKLG